MKDLHVSWDEYNRLVEKLALAVWESGWTFDAIVCLARGGLRIGDVFSRLFDKPLGVLFTSSYRDDAGMTQGRLLIGDQMSSALPLPGPRWLLVDDLADTGATLVQALPVLRARHPQATEIRSAVLWCKGASVARPDYFIEHLPTNPWIHQPFEQYDHMRPGDLKARWG
ncbi:MAG: phosphoribosyltransferase [Burkholderiales bacterium]|nr:MAG: phosphoribosyltransferase [Burkholderiales bacterium]